MGIIALSAHSIRLHEATVKEVKLLVLVVALPVLLIFDGELSRIDGAILIAAFIAYVLFLFSSLNICYINLLHCKTLVYSFKNVSSCIA